MLNVTDLGELASALGTGPLDEALAACQATAEPMLPLEAWLSVPLLEQACRQLQMSPEVAAQCLRCGQWMIQTPAAAALAWLCRATIFSPGIRWASVRRWPVPAANHGPAAGLLPAVALLTGLPITLADNRRRGIRDGVTFRTLEDLELWIGEFRKVHSRWGFDNVGWLASHFRGRLFQVGRLQYELAAFDCDARAYRNAPGQAIALVRGGLRFRRDGQMDGADGVADEQAWTSQLTETDAQVTGHPVDPHGFVQRQPVTLDKRQWQLALDKGDAALCIHIPDGTKHGPLTDAEVARSLADAQRFFRTHFPEHAFKALYSVTWLLDGQLGQRLAAASNIVAFQRRFRLLPVPGANDQQTIERVFGPTFPGWEAAPTDTSLRRAMVEHVRAGGRWRCGAGFILPSAPEEEAP